MEDPVRDIEHVVRLLTQSHPSLQREAIETYFTPNASFQHPFCRTGSFNGSRFLIRAIFRWYKVMSPHIDLDINGIAYDEKNLVMYVNISQVFRIWFVPFYSAPVNLVTVLHLEHDEPEGRYYVKSQNDLYQVNEFVKFIWPGGFLFVWLWQVITTFACFFLALIFWPVSWFEEYGVEIIAKERKKMENFERQTSKQIGSLVNQPAVQQR